MSQMLPEHQIPIQDGTWHVQESKPSPFRSDEQALSFVDYLWPYLLQRLRERLPAEARGMAEEAATAVGLDDLSLMALADWLEEKQQNVLAHRVRRMRLDQGDLLVVQPDHHLTQSAMGELRESFRRVQDQLAARGKDVLCLVLPHGLELRRVPVGGAPNAEG